MNRPPSLIDTQENKKAPPPRKNNRNRLAAYIMLLLVAFLLAFTLAIVTVILIYRPDVLGLAMQEDIETTRAALQETADSLNGTSIALGNTVEFNAIESFNIDSTAAALDNREVLLNQQGTQSALDILATQTSIALSNAQQATQSAIDFQGTQVAFNRLATQAELEYQGTQAALSQNATAAVLGFSTQAPSGEDILSQTPPATITAVPLIQDGFMDGLALWQFSNVDDWTLTGEGELQAARSGAWMLTMFNDMTGYNFQIDLLPLQGATFTADYFILLNVQQAPDAPGSLALRLSYNGERLTAAGLYRFTRTQMMEGVGLLNRGLEAVQAVQVNAQPNTRLAVRVELRGQRVVVVVNDSLVLDATLIEAPPPGAVGVQVPVNTRLEGAILQP